MPVGDSIGLIHLTASLIAVAAGSWVLIGQKGTQLHRRVGYVYAASMVVLIITAFMIYRLFGRFGVFHITAAVSAATLALGMVPVILRKPSESWLNLHFGFMYWSVVGLYAAFAAELLTRIPQKPFFRMVGVSDGSCHATRHPRFLLFQKPLGKDRGVAQVKLLTIYATSGKIFCGLRDR